MRQLNVVQAAVALLEDTYSRVDVPEATEFPMTFLDLANSVSNLNLGNDAERAHRMLVCALSALDTDTRTAYLASTRVASQVLDDLDSVTEWPEPKPPLEYPDLNDDVRVAIRLRALKRLDHLAEKSAHKVLRPGFRYVLTVIQKQLELEAFSGATDPNSEDYPHLHGEIGITGADMSEVTSALRAQVMAWAQTNAQIEKIRLGMVPSILSATDEAEINTVLQTAEQGFNQAVAPLEAMIRSQLEAAFMTYAGLSLDQNETPHTDESQPTPDSDTPTESDEDEAPQS